MSVKWRRRYYRYKYLSWKHFLIWSVNLLQVLIPSLLFTSLSDDNFWQYLWKMVLLDLFAQKSWFCWFQFLKAKKNSVNVSKTSPLPVRHWFSCCWSLSEAYSEPCQTSKLEILAKRGFFRKKLHFRSLTGFWLRLYSCNRNSLVIVANPKLYQLSQNFILQKIFYFRLFRVPILKCFFLKLFCQNFKNACGYYIDNFTAWVLKLTLNLH